MSDGDKCIKCRREIVPEPELGERQGGERHIVHLANTWVLLLCSVCVAPLFELYEEFVQDVRMTGTAPGLDKLAYLPRDDTTA